MGRGDSRTRRGKIFKGSFGNTRSQKVNKKGSPVVTKKSSTTGSATGSAKK